MQSELKGRASIQKSADSVLQAEVNVEKVELSEATHRAARAARAANHEEFNKGLVRDGGYRGRIEQTSSWLIKAVFQKICEVLVSQV